MSQTETDKKTVKLHEQGSLPTVVGSFEILVATPFVVNLQFESITDAEAFLGKFWTDKSQVTQRCFAVVQDKMREFNDPISGDRTFGVRSSLVVTFHNRRAPDTPLSPPTLAWLAGQGVNVETAS